MSVIAPQGVAEPSDFRCEVGGAGDLDMQFISGLHPESPCKGANQWMGVVLCVGHKAIRLALACFDFDANHMQAEDVLAQQVVEFHPDIDAFRQLGWQIEASAHPETTTLQAIRVLHHPHRVSIPE